MKQEDKMKKPSFFIQKKQKFICGQMKNFLFFFSVLLLLFQSSCAPEERGGWVKNGTKTNRKEVFRKLKDYSLALIIMTPQRTYIPGSKTARVIFALQNTGPTRITIKEWRMCESANLRIRYAPGTPAETAKLPLDKWKISPTYDPSNRYAEIYNPLSLHPVDNHALIEVPLNFIKDVRNRGKRQYFTIIAELNLTSVSARSEPILVTVK